MLEALFAGFHQLIQPISLAALMGGVLLGSVIGFIPGINGVVGVALLLPFTFHLPPEVGLPLIMGLLAVTTTADTIPCVLIGTPGTAGSQATVLDGYPMAQKGEAGKALGAAFFVSAVGGVVGAVVLSFSVPIFKPLVLSFGTAEFLAMALLGLSMVAVLSGSSPLRGIIAAGLGLLVAMIGLDPINSLPRWTFGTDYLLNGTSLVAVTMGLFAIPELVDLMASGRTIQKDGQIVPAHVGGKLEGIKAALRNKRLVMGSALLGSWIGFMPGLGTVVANWMAYSLAYAFCKDRENFGKGDVRGVIAPESANNAALGGALIPTLAFGIPGSATTALVLAALWIQGVTPGQSLLRDNLNLIYLIIWSVAVANIVGATLAYVFTDAFARLARVPIAYLAPVALVVIFAGTIVETGEIGDIVQLLVFGVIGWVMKHLDWPRPALILGFVLEPVLEQNYFQSTLIYGPEWLLRPIVMIILAVAVAGMVMCYRLRSLERRRERELTAGREVFQ